MNGILNIYKEKAMTSHDVVSKVRRILKEKKVGHTGTLDPEAEGVLPICVGKATKIADFLLDQNKAYRCEMTLGITTTTEDHTGEIVQIRPVHFYEDGIKQAIYSFVGEYDQVPPMYSALKVEGKKLYEYARMGIEIERKARRIQILDIKIIEMLPPNKVIFDVVCSKGTYIRTLCVDIGEKLGCGAHMSALTRTASGIFQEEDSILLSTLEKIVQEGNLDDILMPMDVVFENYPKLVIKPTANKALENGNMIFMKGIQEKPSKIDTGERFRVYNYENKFIGIYEYIENEEEQKIKPLKLFI